MDEKLKFGLYPANRQKGLGKIGLFGLILT